MCGIWGTTDKERYKSLYLLNTDRGNFAYGCLFTSNEHEHYVQKHQGVKILTESDFTAGARYHLGHIQSPTSRQREFSTETSHPFYSSNWFVAHNGVLSNDRSLASELHVNNPVDTAVIPVLIQREFENQEASTSRAEVTAIESACSLIRGTFACWIYNTFSRNTYLVRCGSTLFYKDDEFSSKQDSGMIPLDEGIVYTINHTAKIMEAVGQFTYNSPYFIL